MTKTETADSREESTAAVATATPTQPVKGTVAGLLPHLALAGIVLAGIYLRWERLEYAQFFRDQAWSLNRAYDFVTRGDFPLVGIESSLGTAQGSLEILLAAIPVAFSKDPLLASGFVGLLQMLAVVGTYWLAGRYFGRAVGLAAAALYAANPWALQYGREVWAPNVAAPFTILFFAALYGAVVDGRRYQLPLACLWLVVLFLAHPSAVFYAPVVLVVVVIFWRRLGLRPLLLGAALGLLAGSTYLWHEYQHGFTSFVRFFGLSAGPAQLDLEALKMVITLASAKYYPNMMGHGFRGEWVLPDQTVQNELATWLLYLGLGVCVWRLAASRLRGRPTAGWERYFLLLLWFGLPILFSLRHSVGYFPHYFLNLLPVQYVLIALGLAQAASALGRPLLRQLPRLAWLPTATITAVVLFLTVSQALYFHRYLDYVQNDEPMGRYGVPLLYSQRAIDTVRALRAELGGPPVYSYSYLQWEVLQYLARPDVELREIDPQEGLALPRDPAAGALFLLADDRIVHSDQKPFVVQEDERTIGRLNALGFVELPERAVRGPLGYPYFRFFWLSPAKARQALASLSRVEQLPLSNGMRLRGYSLPAVAQPGEKITLTALWEVPAGTGNPHPDEYNLFVHLTTGAGRELKAEDWEIAQYHHRLWRKVLPRWRADDLPVAYYELTLPADFGPGLLWADVGAYRRHDRAEARWLDDSGRPLATAARHGPLKVAPPTASPPTVPTAFYIGDAFELVGYDLDRAGLAASGTLAVALHWRARAAPEGDYAVSVQVLDEQGALVTQHDAPPVGGDYPTSHWAAGETIVDRHAVALPAGNRSQVYRLTVVVYSVKTQQRLPVAAAGGTAAVSDRAELATLTVDVQPQSLSPRNGMDSPPLSP